jgi:hypothetical protein
MNHDIIVTSVVSQISSSPSMPDQETQVEFKRHSLPRAQHNMGEFGVVVYWLQIDNEGNAETCTGFISNDMKVYFGGEARVHITTVLGGPQAFEMFISAFTASVEGALSSMVPAAVPHVPDNHLGVFLVGKPS